MSRRDCLAALLLLASMPAANAFAIAADSELHTRDEIQFTVDRRITAQKSPLTVHDFAQKLHAAKRADIESLRVRKPVDTYALADPRHIANATFDEIVALFMMLGLPTVTVALGLYLTWICLRARERERIIMLGTYLFRPFMGRTTREAEALKTKHRVTVLMERRLVNAPRGTPPEKAPAAQPAVAAVSASKRVIPIHRRRRGWLKPRLNVAWSRFERPRQRKKSAARALFNMRRIPMTDRYATLVPAYRVRTKIQRRTDNAQPSRRTLNCLAPRAPRATRPTRIGSSTRLKSLTA